MIREVMFHHPHAPARKHWRILLALLCVVLVVASATVELTHSHAGGLHPGGSHPGCALCATAHVVIQAAPIAALLVFFAATTAVARTAQMRRRLQPTIFSLFTRPPPAARFAAV
ncbi:MAG TPA: hypothetical protein VGB94_10265 [Acidobacteriaceae bacterium]